MANININISEVQKQARLLREASANLSKGTVKPLVDSKDRLASAWTGESAKAFVKYTDELIGQLQSNAKDILEIAAFLENACSTIKKADQEAKSRIKS